MKSKQQFIKICPKCGSIDLPVTTGFAQMIAPTPEKCGKCGYTGLFPEMKIDEIENFRKALGEKMC